MVTCWDISPEKRPSFRIIENRIEKIDVINHQVDQFIHNNSYTKIDYGYIISSLT